MKKLRISLISMSFDLLNFITSGHLSPLVSVAAIIEDQDRVLLINRCDGLGYSFPGGLVKWNETLEQAAEREVEEETGYRISIKEFVRIYGSPERDPRFRCLLLVYTATILSGKGKSSNEGKLAWVSKNNLPQHFAFDNRRVLTDYLSNQNLSFA